MVHLKNTAPLIALIATACIPSFPPNNGLVTEPQVVAVRSDPAEAPEGAAVQWTALYVTPLGEATTAPINWNLCTAREALTDTGPVSGLCFGSDPTDVTPIGSGLSVSGALPSQACRIFGPDPPLAQAGQPAGRPVDPDATGGYYQPVVLHTHVATLGATRISCGVAGATQAASAQFVQEYLANENPSVASLQLGPVGSEATVPPSSEGQPLSVKAGSSNHVIAQWPQCTSGAVCGGAEFYIVFDPSSQQIVQHREAMHVSWYTTGGSFDQARGGIAEADAASSQIENTWVAPSQAGDVTIWVVLVDGRGGAGWQNYTIQVVQ